MSNYKVLKPFEHFAIGDEVLLNPRQAKYRLLSGHIAEVTLESSAPETEAPAVDEASADASAELEFESSEAPPVAEVHVDSAAKAAPTKAAAKAGKK